MKRGNLLESTAVVAATSGLAGCTGLLGGGCGKPSDGLRAAVPRGGSFSLQGEPDTARSETKLEAKVSATYAGPDGKTYTYGINKYEDASTAKQVLDEAAKPETGHLGWVRIDEYVYFAQGPSKSKIEALLAESKPLSKGCVDENTEFA